MIIKEKQEEFQRYLKDESNSISTNIKKVYIPETYEELGDILKNEKNITIYGGGTGLTAGATNNDGVIISTEKFKKIIIDENNKIVKAGAGVSLKELAEELYKKNLWYPIDSTEQTATIGGNIATNASGTRSFKFGCVRNLTQSLTIFFSDGKYAKLKREEIKAKDLLFDFSLGENKINFYITDLAEKFSFKNSAGYYMKKNMDIIDLFIGCEGTLGVIADVELKVFDLPYNIFAFLVYFESREKAFKLVKKLKNFEFHKKPLSIEYFDKNALKFLKNKINNIEIAEAALIIEFMIDNGEKEGEILKFVEDLFFNEKIDSKNIFISSTKYKNDFIYYARESLPQIINEYIRQKGLKKVSTDFAVSDKYFDEMIKIYDKMLADINIDYVIFGHIGDNNFHINFLPKNVAEYENAKQFYDKMAYEIAKIGGTVSAEHGIGKLKKQYLKYMYDEATLEIMRNIKKIFDPEFKLNAGNIFD
jgi:D-lactate dehydrogenase (cytochrome)